MKRCSRCHCEKPPEDFGLNARTRDGRFAYCRPCARDYQRAYHERKKARAAARMLGGPEA